MAKHRKKPVIVENDFKPGDIVVWIGHNPIIARIKRKCNSFNDSWVLTDQEDEAYPHNSCSYLNLRKATRQEVRLLGKKQFVVFEKPHKKTEE